MMRPAKARRLNPMRRSKSLHLIEVGNRLRKLKAAKVIHIKESMAQQGQLQPIIVEPRGDGRFNLLSGNCRKEAADESSLIEIDENSSAMISLRLSARLIRPSESRFTSAYTPRRRRVPQDGAGKRFAELAKLVTSAEPIKSWSAPTSCATASIAKCGISSASRSRRRKKATS
jgi:hypothetical protein